MADETHRGSAFRWAAFAAVLLPVFYTLSVGPAVYFVERTRTGDDAVRTVYLPLIWLHDNTPFGKALEWYTEPWEKAARR
jgi:hypothetical protein